VTAHAGGRRIRKDVVEVAGRAIECGVGPSQGKAGELQVVEGGTEPVVHRVAGFAGSGQPELPVVEHRRLEILLVTRDAGGRQSLELAHSSILVAGVALQQGMGAYQWKAIVVVANRLDINLPALHGMALLAIGSKLPTMNIRMAIGAARTHVAEDQTGVALRAAHVGVHAPQGIPGLVVVELGLGADRFPTSKRVAILAGAVQRPVRTLNVRPWSGPFLTRRRSVLVRRGRRRQERHERYENGQDDWVHDGLSKIFIVSETTFLMDSAWTVPMLEHVACQSGCKRPVWPSAAGPDHSPRG